MGCEIYMGTNLNYVPIYIYGGTDKITGLSEPVDVDFCSFAVFKLDKRKR